MKNATRQEVTYKTLCSLAIACFLYALATLGLQWIWISECAQTINAAVLAALWAICPPAWFMLERWIWETPENQTSMAITQDHVRDLWLGMGALVLFLADKRFLPEHCGIPMH